MAKKKIAILFAPALLIIVLIFSAPDLFSNFKQHGLAPWGSAAERGSPAGVNATDNYGITPLMRAALDGRTQDVRWLLNKGANVNARDKDSETALMAAAYSGHGEVVNMLIRKGADVNVISQGGSTALTLARKNGHDQVVRMLVAGGAKDRTVIGTR
jgi:ankyrin repeat protein